MKVILYQLRLSHFNEKARWALDYKGVAHERRTSLPAWHALRAMRMTGKQTMPILVLDGDVIGESAEIIDRLESLQPDPPLYPPVGAERERALELQRFFDDGLGPAARRIFFWHMLAEEPAATRDSYTKPVGSLARATYVAAFPLTKVAMRRALNINAPAVERSEAKVVAALDRIEAELGDRDHLVGDRFSVADLTAASLLFPLLQPPEFQYDYPERFATGLLRYRESLCERRAVSWALEAWSRYRGSSAGVD